MLLTKRVDSLALAVILMSWFGVVVLSGCGGGSAERLPPMGKVTGVVTLDGIPLSGAQVTFEPRQGGVTSSASTNEKGEYNLFYQANAYGALVGEHVVRITTQNAETSVEKLPVIYHEKSTLTANVSDGENTINFPLESRPAKKK